MSGGVGYPPQGPYPGGWHPAGVTGPMPPSAGYPEPPGFPAEGAPGPMPRRPSPPDRYSDPELAAADMAWMQRLQSARTAPGPGRPRFKSYSKPPATPTSTVLGTQSSIVVVDGVRNVLESDGFDPKTLLLGVGGPLDMDAAGLVLGAMTFEVRGLQPGGFWIRRFGLPAGASIQISLERFVDVAVYVIACDAGLAGFSAACGVTDAVRETTQETPVFLATTYATAGNRIVPYGAAELFPATADAGFAWSSSGIGGAAVVPEAVVVGTPTDVKGTRYTTTVAPWSAIWRITL